MEKVGGFIGKQALLKHRKAGTLTQRIVQFTLYNAHAQLWGGELVLRNGTPVCDVRSVAYGHTLKPSVALALLQDEAYAERVIFRLI